MYARPKMDEKHTCCDTGKQEIRLKLRSQNRRDKCNEIHTWVLFTYTVRWNFDEFQNTVSMHV